MNLADSILRQLPMYLDKEQRLRFEALVFTLDASQAAYDAIRSIAAHHQSSSDVITGEAQTMMTLMAWSFVDQIHAARLLLKPICNKFQVSEFKSFFEKTEGTTTARNKMDHLNTNIGNLSRTKGYISPIFGTLSWIATRKKSDSEYDIKIVSVISGSTVDGRPFSGMPVPSPETITHNVCQFMFFAFGQTIDMDSQLQHLLNALEKLSEIISPQIEKQVKATADKLGVTLEVARSSGIGQTVLEMDIEFD